MKRKHAPEPWRFTPCDFGGHQILDANYDFVLKREPYEGLFWVKFEKSYDVARAVECVNACSGMDDPEKEIARLKDLAWRYESLNK